MIFLRKTLRKFVSSISENKKSSFDKEEYKNLKLIVGLGNPGQKYNQTRHNVGFEVIDRLERELKIDLNQSKFKGIYGSKGIGEDKLFLLKPLTFMNLSGESVVPLMDYFKMTPKDLLVVYDDLDLSPGKIRLRQKGSHGGHNGMRSLIQHLGTEEFNRIRIGIGRPQSGKSIPDYVLGSFSPDERLEINDAVEKAERACTDWTKMSFLQVMNKYN